MKKVLLISDVHMNIEQMNKIMDEHKDADLKIFTGDLQMGKDVEEALFKQFDIHVLGNMDFDNGEDLIKFTNIEDIKVMIVHGHAFENGGYLINFDEMFSYARKNEVKLILHGHDHVMDFEERNGIKRINPGAITNPKGGNGPSYAIFTIDKDNVSVEFVNL